MANSIVLAIANQKGGVGKTTTAIELAAAFHEEGKKVLIIDLDQQCNLTSYVNADVENVPTIYDILHAKAPVVDGIQHLKYYDVIASSSSLSRADREFVDSEDVYLLGDLLRIDDIQNVYDYIIIDNSPSRNILLTMAYIAADHVIIPTECDDGALDGIIAINNDLKKLRESRAHYTDADVLGLILVKYERTVMHDVAYKLDLSEIAKVIGSDPFIMNVRKSISVSESKKEKKPLQEYDKYSNPAADYRKIVKEIMKRLEA